MINNINIFFSLMNMLLYYTFPIPQCLLLCYWIASRQTYEKNISRNSNFFLLFHIHYSYETLCSIFIPSVNCTIHWQFCEMWPWNCCHLKVTNDTMNYLVTFAGKNHCMNVHQMSVQSYINRHERTKIFYKNQTIEKL